MPNVKAERKMSAKDQEKREAIETLRKWLKPGTKVYTILRHVSSSGMSRSISLVVPVREKGRDGKMRTDMIHLDGNAARALGYTFDRKNGGIKMSGAGMDMGFHLVYNLGRTLFPNGGSLKNTNGARASQAERAGETREDDGGYLLRHEWL